MLFEHDIRYRSPCHIERSRNTVLNTHNICHSRRESKGNEWRVPSYPRDPGSSPGWRMSGLRSHFDHAQCDNTQSSRNIISRRKKPGSTVVMKLNSKTVAIWPSFDGNGVFASFFAGKKMRNCTHNICHSRRESKRQWRHTMSIDALRAWHKGASHKWA